MMNWKKLTANAEAQRKWITSAVSKPDKTNAEKYIGQLLTTISELRTLNTPESLNLAQELDQFVLQESQRLKMQLSESSLQELRKEAATWTKWIDQALQKRNEKTVLDYCKKFRDVIEKRRELVEVTPHGQQYLAELYDYIEKSQGGTGSFDLINSANKLLETCTFKLKWVRDYLDKKEAEKAARMYEDLQKAVAPILADARYMQIAPIAEFMEQYNAIVSIYSGAVGAIHGERSLNKDTEKLAAHIKFLSKELNDQRRVSYIKGYVTKLENLLSPYAQKYAHEASAAPLIDEATLLIATANATVDQLTLENRAADITKTARVKIKYLAKCLDEEKVSLCQKLFQELEKLVEPLLDTKLISLDSVVQFYPEYEDIAERYKAEIGIIQLNKQMSEHSAKISFLLKCLSNEMGERGDTSKVQSYVKKLQLAVEPLTQFDGYAPADELVEQVKTNIYEAEAFVEEKRAQAKVDQLVKQGQAQLDSINRYITEKDSDRILSTYDNLLLLEKQTFDETLASFPAVQKLQSDIKLAGERVTKEVGDIVKQKQLGALSQDVTNKSKWLRNTLHTRDRIANVALYKSKLESALGVLLERFPEKSEDAIVQEAQQLLNQAHELIEKKKQEEEALLERAREAKELKSQEKADRSIESARQRMEVARMKKEANECLKVSRSSSSGKPPAAVNVEGVTQQGGSTGGGGNEQVEDDNDDTEDYLRLDIEKDSLVPVFDSSTCDKKIYSIIMSINRSTDRIYDMYEQFQELLSDLLDSKYIQDELTSTHQLRGIYDNIVQSLESIMFYAPKLKEVSGGKAIYNMIEQRVTEAKQTIKGQMDSVSRSIPFDNKIKTAKGYIKAIEKENTSKKEDAILDALTRKLITRIVPTIDQARQLCPDRAEECNQVEEAFKTCMVQIRQDQEVIGRKLISVGLKQQDVTFVNEVIDGLSQILEKDRMDALTKDIEVERKQVEELVRIEEERKRVEAEKEAERLAEIKRKLQDEWKGKYTRNGKVVCVNNGDVWQYNADGNVTLIAGKSEKVDMFWTGSDLVRTDRKAVGTWDGGRAAWQTGNLLLYSYIWRGEDSKYHSGAQLVSQIVPEDWLWTGTKLVSSKETFEVTEGEVPHPVVLFIAMLTYAPMVLAEYIKLQEKERLLKMSRSGSGGSGGGGGGSGGRAACGRPFAKDQLYMCHSCGFGSAHRKCVSCGGAFANVPAKMCSSCAFGSKKCVFCKSHIFSGSGYPALLCSSCGFGSNATRCQNSS